MKVLVTGAGALLGQGVMRALERSSLDAKLIAADPSPLSAGLHWTDEAYLVPMANDPAYVERLGEIIAKAKPDIVIPGTDAELAVLAANREALERDYGTNILVSDERAVEIADDKYQTFQFFDEAGFRAPASARPENAEELRRVVETVGFPLVVKPRRGARSIGVSVVNSQAELDAALAGREGLVVQECIGTDDGEYTASVVVFDGKPRASIVMRRDLRDGNTYRAFTEAYPELNEQVRAFGAALGPYGPANFQFRLDREGRPCVFEINCRFSGTTPLRAAVGFNEVEMCIRHILFGEEVTQPNIEHSTILRFWSEIVVPPSQVEQLG
ncbi:ATP-grasp domain-containing protein [Sphingomonas sabuli]|uniref:ATP-grasp domain-containing protein n=1 Tax=Sphingomonas sabuli TaxID=2764186 RepID=A0A7G9L5S8_9SPHN|nr:ATP-grasp domain-containing protein [Sphingomonas sabuli]